MSESDSTLTTHSADSCFDPQVYNAMYYTYSEKQYNEDEVDVCAFLRESNHDLFKQGELKGKKLLDIGTGPIVYNIITPSKWFDEIYLSDVAKTNVDFLQRWRRGNSEPMKRVMERFAKKEQLTCEDIESRVLEKIKDVVEIDISKQNLLSGTSLENETFDAITAWLCLSTVPPFDIEGYKNVLGNIRALLKPGGHLAVGDMLDQSFYAVGDMKFRTASTTVEKLQRAYRESGFQIEKWDTVSVSYNKETESDVMTAFCLLGKKV